MSERYLSINECAESLGVSRWTISREIEDGVLPVVVIRGSPRVDPADFDQYLSKKKTDAAAAIAARKSTSSAPKRGRGRPRKASVGGQ